MPARPYKGAATGSGSEIGDDPAQLRLWCPHPHVSYGLIDSGPIAPVDDDRRTASRKTMRNSEADTPGGAGDNRNLARKVDLHI